MREPESSSEDLSFSLVRGDPWFRVQRSIGLIPAEGLGIGRRCLVFAAVTWLPIALWAELSQRALPGAVDEPLLRHFGVHSRCLLAIPLFLIAEAVGDYLPRQLIPYFVSSGLVAQENRPRFVQAVRASERLRDGWAAWALMVAAVLVFVVVDRDPARRHELIWASGARPTGDGFGFGAWWFLFVVRPTFVLLLSAWVWRLVVCTVLLWRILRVPLELVPTHPDRSAGLGFLEDLPFIFSPVVLGMSVVMASRWGHDALYHQVDVYSLAVPFAVYVAAVLVVFLGPLALFFRRMLTLKRQALLEYGALVGQHGRLVRKRWIAREPVESSPLLAAPELGPVIDTVSMYEVVDGIRPSPLGMRSLMAVVVPAVVPMIPVFAIQVPMRSLLLQVLKTLL